MTEDKVDLCETLCITENRGKNNTTVIGNVATYDTIPAYNAQTTDAIE